MPPPNIPFEQLPAGTAIAFRNEPTGEVTYMSEEPAQQSGVNPRQYFERGLRQNQDFIKQQYGTQWKMLHKTSKSEEQFRQNVDKLIAETDTKLNEIQYEYDQKIGILDQIKGMADQGLLTQQTSSMATRKIMGLPEDKQADWRLEHGRIIGEYKRIADTIEALDVPKTWGGKYKWNKMNAKQRNQLELLLNAKEVLLQQEREIYENLPQLNQKAVGLQTAQLRKEGRYTYPGGTGIPTLPDIAYRKPVGFSGKVLADKPKPRSELQQLNAETAQQILQEAGGDKTLARQLAKQRGYKL